MTAPLLLHVFPSFAAGGAQIRFAAVANRFGPAWRHAIVALDGDLSCRARLAPGLDVAFPEIAIRKGATLPNVLRYARFLGALRPDRLVTSNWGSIEWAMANHLAGIPHLHMEDGFGPEERVRQLPRRVRARRLFLRRSEILLPSQTLFAIARDLWRLPPARLHYVPNGVDLAASAAPAPAVALPAAADGPLIGTIAALRPEKALDRLLRAFRIVTERMPARLLLVGDGPERAKLQALAAELGITARVAFAGHLPDPRPLYASFDLFALSSDTEQMPLSVLEAMAAARAVAATAVGDIASMLAPGNRPFLCPPDPARLAAAIQALLEAPDLRAAIGAANRARAEQEFDQERMFERFAALYRTDRQGDAA